MRFRPRLNLLTRAQEQCIFGREVVLKDIWGLCLSRLAASDGVFVEVSGSLLASYISDDSLDGRVWHLRAS